MQRKVIPVSPNTFYLYLQTIILGLKGLEVEKNALQIISALDRLRVDFGKFARDFELTGTHLRRAVGSYDSADRDLARFEDKLSQISSARSGEESQAASAAGETERAKRPTE